MKTVTIFQANDGTRFDTEEECILYEDHETQAWLCKRLLIATYDLNEGHSIKWFLYKLQVAIQNGLLYTESPTRTPYNHMRKWLEKDEADLVSYYQDWLQKMGVQFGRTPRSVQERLIQALKRMRDAGQHIKT